MEIAVIILVGLGLAYLVVGGINLLIKWRVAHRHWPVTRRNWYKSILAWPIEIGLLIGDKEPF
jgi:hypothetical protein